MATPTHLKGPSTTIFDPKRLINEKEAATFLGVTRRALQQWRLNGSGPIYVKISARCVRYRRRELDEWAEKRLRSNTSQKEGAECE